MNMKKIFIYTAILAIVATACSKLENEPVQEGKDPNEVKMITEKVSGNVEPSSKATIADADAAFSWTTGDDIAVHVSNGETSKFVFTSDAGAQGASTTGASASFTVVYEEGYSRDAFAVYPSTIVTAESYNTGTSTLTVNLPATYTLAKVTGETTPCPMIAENTPGSGWEFKQLCGLLRLTVNGIPSEATGMVIQFPGKKVNGDFSIVSPNPGTSTIATGIPVAGEDKITVTFAAGNTSATVNIPLPTGTYDDVYITPIGTETKVAAVRHINGASYTAARKHGKKITTTMVAFSVGASKKVVFAPGNLWATSNSGTNWTWSFAPYQYSRIGNATANTAINGKGSVSTDGTVDLFGFSTSNTSYGIWNDKTASNYSGVFDEWGKNNIGGYSANEWGTLSGDEMTYLLNTRGGDNYAKVNFNFQDGIKGIIIFPDGFVWDNSTMGDKPDNINVSASSFSDGTISSRSNWNNIESAGAVFLPVAGYRNGTSVSQPTNYGYYWLSNGQVLYFRSDLKGDYVKLDSHDRYYGHSVRLVRVL